MHITSMSGVMVLNSKRIYTQNTSKIKNTKHTHTKKYFFSFEDFLFVIWKLTDANQKTGLFQTN